MNARKTFADCGIEGKNLDLLARAVAPEIAREWADWLHAVDRKRWTRPEGYLVKKLLGDKQTAGDPKAKPPFVKTESAEGQRPIIGRISGHLAEKARALQRERAQEEGEE